MRTSSAFLLLLAVVTVASLATLVRSGRQAVVEAVHEDRVDFVGHESPAQKRDSVTPSVPAEVLAGENLHSDNRDSLPIQTQSLRALLGISIEWKKRPVLSSPEALRAFQAAVVDFNAAELVRLAKEEHVTDAASVLAVRKADCKNAPTTREALKAEMEAVEQSGIVGSSLTEGHQVVSDEELRIRLQVMEGVFEKCTQIRNVLDGDDTDFMKLAADNGNPVAMLNYGNSVLGDDADLAKSYYERSWELGESEALRILSTYENDRFERGDDPSADIESVALFAAYAAVEEAKIERYGIDPSHPVAQALAETGDEARARLDSLVPYKRELALARARELIDSNSRCCLRIGW